MTFDFEEDTTEFELTVSAEDETGTGEATIAVTVADVNENPSVSNAEFTIEENTVAPVGSVSFDDPDDGETFTFDLTVGDDAFEIDGSGEIRNIAAFDFESDATEYNLTVEITDAGGLTDTASVLVSVLDVNDVPTAANVSGAAVEDGPIVAGSFDAADDETPELVYALITSPEEGSVAFGDVNGTFEFDPGEDFQNLPTGATRDVSFDYTATDGEEITSAAATVTITVTGVNDSPDAKADTESTDENVATSTAVLANDTDVDSDDSPANFSVDSIDSVAVSGLTTGSELITGTVATSEGEISFDPGTDFDELDAGDTATVTIGYTMSDDESAPSSSTLTITVAGLNDVPVADDVAAAADEDGEVVAGSFVADDVDGEDTPASLTYTITTDPDEGSVTPGVDAGTFVFDPGTDFQDLSVGEERIVSFDYTASDSQEGTSVAGTVTITVTGVNDLPVADDVVGPAADEDGEPVTGSFDADDVDTEDTPATLTYNITTQPDEGSVTPGAVNGTFNFDPGADFQDLDDGDTREVSFDYTVTDTRDATSTLAATVTITVDPGRMSMSSWLWPTRFISSVLTAPGPIPLTRIP